MDAMNIRSGMTHFRLIAKISEVSTHRICGEARFQGTPGYLVLEAMAQLAALHVRWRFQFECHAFLLNVKHCQLPAKVGLTGNYRVTAAPLGQSSNAFHYEVVALGSHGDDFKSDLLIGSREYDDHFQENIIKAHYQGVMAQLEE